MTDTCLYLDLELITTLLNLTAMYERAVFIINSICYRKSTTFKNKSPRDLIEMKRYLSLFFK